LNHNIKAYTGVVGHSASEISEDAARESLLFALVAASFAELTVDYNSINKY
jgi:hypothetical protein